MKVTSTGYRAQAFNSIEEYADSKLDGSEYDGGALEGASQTAHNCASAIGRLLDVLADKGLINEHDVGNIVDGYDGCVEFVKGEA